MKSNSTFSHKKALVTGASRNIGREICLALAKQGCQVAACSRDAEALFLLNADLHPHPVGHKTYDVNLMEPLSTETLLKKLNQDNFSPDIVVHNLGGSLSLTDPFSNWLDYEKCIRFNLGVSIEINNSLIPEMRKRKWGRIIHLSTLATKTFSGNIPYLVAKCAVDGYVKSMSRNLIKDGIVMCAVAPGLVNVPGRYYTELEKTNPEKLDQYFETHLPLGRMIKQSEVADAVAVLCSSLSDAMPGAIIPVDGGGH